MHAGQLRLACWEAPIIPRLPRAIIARCTLLGASDCYYSEMLDLWLLVQGDSRRGLLVMALRVQRH